MTTTKRKPRSVGVRPGVNLGIAILVTACLGPAGFALAGSALPAEISFSTSDGWITFSIQHPETGAQEALIRVLGANGELLENVKTDEYGRGRFRIPDGDRFSVGVVMESRAALPIRLTKVGATVVPNRVSLSFELLPCCQVPSRFGFSFQMPRDSDTPIAWPTTKSEMWELAGWSGMILGAAAFAFQHFRARRKLQR